MNRLLQEHGTLFRPCHLIAKTKTSLSTSQPQITKLHRISAIFSIRYSNTRLKTGDSEEEKEALLQLRHLT